MSTVTAKQRPTKRKLTIEEMYAREVAAHDRRVDEIISEMSRPQSAAKPAKKPK